MKELRIGLVGAGTVGQALISILKESGGIINERIGTKLNIQGVYDRSASKKKEALKEIKIYDNVKDLIQDATIDVVVELIGGVDAAREVLELCIANDKPFVSANKALLAKDGLSLLKKARERHIPVGFEAAVCGAIPVIRTLRRGFVGNKVQSLFGILNGTCNYILSRMEDGQSYEVALKKAQELGFAEANPAFDVEGRDAAQKLAILAGLIFDSFFYEKDIVCEGIEHIASVDISIAKRMGYAIRLLGVARMTNDGVMLRVHPAMVPLSHALATVRDEHNALFIHGSLSGPYFQLGLGAGGRPTAAAVISDLASIALSSTENTERWFAENKLPLLDDFQNKFYLRFQTKDKPGVIAEIARILSNHSISIASVHQEEGPEPVDVVVVTHEASEKSMNSALLEIDELPVLAAPTIRLRIEDKL